MDFNLISLLSRYRNLNDFESDVAVFRTNTPHRAPLAYLHILFKPAPTELQDTRCRQLGIPPRLSALYACHNGAKLFGGTIRIFGFLPDKYVLNRKDWRNLPPFNILDLNERHQTDFRLRDMVGFADYDIDGSLVCVERHSGRIVCFWGRSLDKERNAWASVDDWIREEISRLSLCFDETGHCLVDEDKLLPTPNQTPTI